MSDDIDAAADGPRSLLADAVWVPHPGAGLVARWGDVLLVAAEATGDVATRLARECSAVAEVGGDGRVLSRRLAGFLTTHDGDVPAFAVAAPTAGGLAVFVQGAAQVVVGDTLTISGADSLSWVDRLIPWPVTALSISVAGPATEPVTTGLYDLRLGAVPGAGLTLARRSEGEGSAGPEAAVDMPLQEAGEPTDDERPDDRPAEAALAGGSAQPAPPPDRWPGQGPAVPAFESVVISLGAAGDGREESLRPPLPVASEASHRRSAGVSGPIVRGVYCKNGHFDDPRALFCVVCGINMVQQTPVLTEGPRPPLGVLVLDDGSAFQLDADYVLGREPTHDLDVDSGRLRGIVLSDEDTSVSRAHARIELRQWDVVLIDNGSANGTYVAGENEQSWTPLPPGKPHVLTSGTRIRLGSRTLAFSSYRGE
jgi:FHA domain